METNPTENRSPELTGAEAGKGLIGREVPLESLLTTKQIAKKLQISDRTVQSLVARKKIRSLKIGRCIRFRLSEVLADLESNR